jgi:hypothetical protein
MSKRYNNIADNSDDTSNERQCKKSLFLSDEEWSKLKDVLPILNSINTCLEDDIDCIEKRHHKSLFVSHDEWLEQQTNLVSKKTVPFALGELECGFQIELVEDIFSKTDDEIDSPEARCALSGYEEEFEKFLRRSEFREGGLTAWKTCNELVHSNKNDSFIEMELKIPRQLQSVELIRENRLDEEVNSVFSVGNEKVAVVAI